jgi:hypothetical protein
MSHCPNVAFEVMKSTIGLPSGSAYSTLKIEGICTSKTSADFQLLKRRYIPEYSTLHYPNNCIKELRKTTAICFDI